jgi:hypothetical protein
MENLMVKMRCCHDKNMTTVTAHPEKMDAWQEEIKVWPKTDISLPRKNRGLSRKGKGQPGRNGDHSGCLQRNVGQNRNNGFGG